MTDSALATEAAPIAFYAPLKSPNHPTPSGDRRMARLLQSALSAAGFAPTLASEFRSFLGAPDPAAFAARAKAGAAEAERLIAAFQALPAERQPRLWFTYHLYYKAPDYLGPRVAGALGLPYAVAEASRARKRFAGPWAESAMDAEAGIDLADLIFCMTGRDRPALAAALDSTQTLVDLPPFLELPGQPPAKEPLSGRAARLLAVAMMRPGDKRASYETLAAALGRAQSDWRLEIAGDGPDAAGVRALFEPFGSRVAFLGQLAETALAEAYRRADLLVWPGVGEAYGMAYLEARAQGTPALAEDRPGVRDVLGEDGFRAPQDDPAAFAAALDGALGDGAALARRSAEARAAVEARHSLAAAADTLRRALGPRVARGPASRLDGSRRSARAPRKSAS